MFRRLPRRYAFLYAALAVALVASLCASELRRPRIQFASEIIDIDIHDNFVVVTGDYTLRNTSGRATSELIEIPYPIDRAHPRPTEVVAYLDSESNAPLRRYEFLTSSSYLTVPFGARQTRHLIVRYRQSTPARDARYILLSTQSWGRPLENGLYRLHPKAVGLADSNYPVKALGAETFGFERTDFMPEADWRFSWSVDK